MKKFFLPVLALLMATGLMAQIKTPSASPSATLKQTVGLTDVTIEYSRPSAKGRTIFGEKGLVPYGEVWRLGANSATKITFSDDVKVGDADLKAGSYAVLSMPGAKEWTFMFYTYETGNWGSYMEKEPAAKVSAMPKMSADAVETFTIGVGGLTNTGATIDIAWEKTRVSLPLTVMVHDRVMADIKRVMAGPSANDYFAAASYLHDSGGDLKLALEYVQKANASEPRFWMLRRESLILADLGRKQEAIAAAERSLALAKEANNNDYIRMNMASIEEWRK